jgi:probable F420-dependent oxidoreductase
MALRFGLALPHYDFSSPDGEPATVGSVTAWAQAAEGMGFDSVWVWDHLFLDLVRYGGPPRRYGTPEPLTMLGALARSTERVRLGALVLCYAFRNPVLLAKEASTVDLASGGRLDLGLGAGWYEAEFAAMGIPFPRASERIAALDEYLGVLDRLFRGGAVSHDGRWVLRDAENVPGPAQRPRPPVWIGSKGGPRMLGVIARRADGWNTVWRVEPGDYASKVSALEAACESAGRDPATVCRSIGLMTIVGEDERDLAARWEGVRRWMPGETLDGAGLDPWRRDALAGTPESCVERLREFESLGVEEVVLSFGTLPFAVADAEMPALFAERVLPAFR